VGPFADSIAGLSGSHFMSNAGAANDTGYSGPGSSIVNAIRYSFCFFSSIFAMTLMPKLITVDLITGSQIRFLIKIMCL
jgi:hypothetical protein